MGDTSFTFRADGTIGSSKSSRIPRYASTVQICPRASDRRRVETAVCASGTVEGPDGLRVSVCWTLIADLIAKKRLVCPCNERVKGMKGQRMVQALWEPEGM